MKAQIFLLLIISYLSFHLTNAQKDDGIYQPDPSTLIYLPKINLTLRTTQDKPRYTFSFKDLAITSTTNPNNATIDISFSTPEQAVKDATATGLSLKLEITKERGSWFLKKSSLTGTVGILTESSTLKDAAMKTGMELTAPIPMSFHCGRYGPFTPKLIEKEKDNTKKNVTILIGVELLDFQFQPFMKNNSRFGDSYDCVGFFSIGILSGIFITIMLIGILSWAISMIMNVHTMDRFDDPKGKSIQVSATD